MEPASCRYGCSFATVLELTLLRVHLGPRPSTLPVVLGAAVSNGSSLRLEIQPRHKGGAVPMYFQQVTAFLSPSFVSPVVTLRKSFNRLKRRDLYHPVIPVLTLEKILLWLDPRAGTRFSTLAFPCDSETNSVLTRNSMIITCMSPRMLPFSLTVGGGREVDV